MDLIRKIKSSSDKMKDYHALWYYQAKENKYFLHLYIWMYNFNKTFYITLEIKIFMASFRNYYLHNIYCYFWSQYWGILVNIRIVNSEEKWMARIVAEAGMYFYWCIFFNIRLVNTVLLSMDVYNILYDNSYWRCYRIVIYILHRIEVAIY